MTANAPFVQIPLYLVQVSPGEIKVGIKIAINGGLAMLYELDTGASGFYPAAEIPASNGGTSPSLAWWTDFQAPAGIANFTQNYSSGNCYTAVSTPATLTFEGNSYIYSSETNEYQAGSVPAVTVNVGAIVDAINSNKSNFAENWCQSLTSANVDIKNNRPIMSGPLDNYFFGDFGIGLGNAANSGTNEGAPVLAVLPQFPAPFCNQFTIDLGPVPDSQSWPLGQTIQQGTLTLGPPPVIPGSNPSTVYMNPTAAPQPYPAGASQVMPFLYTFAQAQVSAAFTLTDQSTGGLFTLPNVPMVLDTGCPGMMIHLGENGPLSTGTGGQIGSFLTQNNNNFSVIANTTVAFAPAVTAGFTVGTGDGDFPVTATELTAAKPGKQFGYVNTSIKTFFDNTVTFNLLEGTLTLYPQG
ncbi:MULTISPECIES: hypothetical protein [unclassified Azospirillum]|uniref:hypothetical protein n=1 Tax=unclassified Azospirillum TaxID=2630922 RepID=UPI000B6B29A0|nr:MULTISPECIES: hypothetical protein [unclassified Azospirillum]SNR87596.1 hypothetical protein SAMN05880556_101284 [Azospirillum sp. RU38E]SNS03767.1 hypothetical protein SAMN05880591_101284 [Azospirillum sp. RU37A]